MIIAAVLCRGVAAMHSMAVKSGWPVIDGVCRRGEGPTAAVRLAGQGPFPPADGSVKPVASRAGDVTTVSYEQGGLRLEDCLEPMPGLGPNGRRRSLRFTNGSGQTVDLVRAYMHIQSETVAAEPSAWAQHPFHMVRTRSGKLLCAAKWNRSEGANLRGSKEGRISMDAAAEWRLAPGQTAVIRYLDIWTGDAMGDDPTRREARRWFAAHGFVKPIRYPDWIYRAILYEASAAGHIDSRFSDTGGFDAFAKQLPYLEQVGVNGFWLNAVQMHKHGAGAMQGWNHYGPRDQLRIDPILGGTAGFQRLTQAMRRHGMRLISEIVPHGGRSVQAKALPAWHTRKRDGTLRKNWGGFGMDNASRQWQDVLRRSMRMLADAGAVEGVRIDVALGQGPNWGSPRTNHASNSTMGACLELMAALRDGIRTEACPTPILLPECRSEPELFTIPDASTLGYGWGFWMFARQLDRRIFAKPAQLNEKLRGFLENERGSLPPGALELRTLNNHDTVCHLGRASFRFGVGLQRALYGVMLSVPGVPMMYQEEEIGSFFALRRLNLARRSLPQLAAAPVVYPPAGFGHPHVFVSVRVEPDQPVLCMVNMSSEPASLHTALPKTFAVQGHDRLWDAVSGRSAGLDADGRFRWALGSYQTAFLTTAAAEAPPAPPLIPTPTVATSSQTAELALSHGGLRVELDLPDDTWSTGDAPSAVTRRFGSEAGTVAFTQTEEGVAVSGELATTSARPGLTLTVRGAQRWSVSGRTALLDDLVMRRHFPFPEGSGYEWKRNQAWGHLPWRGLYRGVAPSGRFWQSIVEPLHPDRPALGFADATGRGVVVSDLRTDAMNVVLTNAADETPDPERLELRVLGIDPDLAPSIQHFGRGQPWRLAGLKPVQSQALHVSFVLCLTESADQIRVLLAAPRHTVEPVGSTFIRDAPRFTSMRGRLFLPKPGRVAWEDLVPVRGRFEIELELRLSERSAEHTDLANAYEIALDGQVLPIRWRQKNTWSTGNAFFAKARIGPVDLSRGRRRLSIRTLHTWCALTPTLSLIPVRAE